MFKIENDVPIPARSNGGPKRRCKLQHVNTGRIITASSISAFCRKARLSKTAKYHLTPVLDGKRLSHKGWFKPETLKQRLSLRDVYGNVYPKITLREAVRKRILSAPTAQKLYDGHKTRAMAGRLTLASTEDTSFVKPRSHHIVRVVLRKGQNTIRAKSLSEAAAQLGSHPTALYPLAYGIADHLKGYRLAELRVERNKALNLEPVNS